MTINELRKRKKELGYSLEKIAELSGVSLQVVKEFFLENTVEAITYEEKIAIEQVLKETSIHEIEEARLPYLTKKQGEYTIEDYDAIAEDVRVELIDGVLIEMEAPPYVHQKIVAEVTFTLKSYIKKKKGKCEALPSPLDVQLDYDDKTIVQPDVIVICDRNKIIRRGIYGAPDFVVEILSPSTRKKDMTIKLSKYMNAGVREYWMVDPDGKRIIVYNWEQEEILNVYGFDSKVPVGIFNGECEVDFAKINDEISFLYE